VMVEYWKKAGKNVAGGSGLSFPVSFYVRLLVLMSVRSLNSREMEQYISESVVARVFLEVREPLRFQLKDHSSIARAQAGLGEEGYKQVNQLMVKEAVRLGFAKTQILSSDTTVQEPLIGYPHEAGILRVVAQRMGRIASKLKQAGVECAEQLSGKVKEVLRVAKHYYLFARSGEEKTEALKQIVSFSEELLTGSTELIESGMAQTSQVVKSGIKKLKELGKFTKELMPQIKGWMETGQVAAEKLLHAGITQARAMVKNKTGKKVEFGLKWLINRIGGGYVFGEVVEAHSSEAEMPLEALAAYRKLFGNQATPEMMVYSRGGRLSPNAAEVGESRSQESRDSTKGEKAMVNCRGRPTGSDLSARQNRRGDRNFEERAVRIQSGARTNQRDVKSSGTTFDVGDELKQYLTRLGGNIETHVSLKLIAGLKKSEAIPS